MTRPPVECMGCSERSGSNGCLVGASMWSTMVQRQSELGERTRMLELRLLRRSQGLQGPWIVVVLREA